MSAARKATKLSIEEIENIASNLRQMPEIESAPTKSKAEAVQMLKGEIEQLKERGYSFEQIAEALSSNGLKLSVPTLKNYLYRAKQKGGENHPKKPTRKQKEDSKPGTRKPRKVDKSKASFDLTPDTDDI